MQYKPNEKVKAVQKRNADTDCIRIMTGIGFDNAGLGNR